ncbi:hypothetical protein Val02_64370 [Virgisporangium aliadipatigenens]|uniref:Peptidase S8/S53 domain-containing protein n=1 Tax=Virgisporangium aliadipatigenens TaxID=741659 RepID=A0A8J3YTI7_9ACTN|nr:hypothetical protein Val02_64370 [Virgisporangium aliadipatigenens]
MATRRSLSIVVACLLLIGGVILFGFPATSPAAPETGQYVKYYTVKDGSEQLNDIATRLLGDGARSTEIYNLNAGRTQLDGGKLTDARTLKSGWSLILPWDAVGDGVQYGELPAAAPVAPPKSPQPNSAQGQGRPPSSPPASPKPSNNPQSNNNPANTGKECATAAASTPQSNWAGLRMAPDQAWERTKGKGVLVAVIDSGVDASLPQLSGRVTEGADIVAGSGRGDADCLGSGTAMASIIGAQPEGDAAVVGIAPEATILPVRLVHGTTQSDAAAEATAVEVAVSAGASVVALGSFVDLRDPAVSAAVTSALKHDVLVVAGAPTENVRLPAIPPGAPGALLSVAGVGVDGQLAGSYQPGTVDVVAPGIEVPTLGTNGTGVVVNSGTQYAVAYAAGEAALVRAAYPHLSAAQVRNRMRVTADKMGAAGDQATSFGSGMINPSAALSATVADETHAAPVDDGRSGTAGRILAVVVLVIVLIVAIAMLALRLRRWARPDDDDDDDDDFPHDTHNPGYDSDRDSESGENAVAARDAG